MVKPIKHDTASSVTTAGWSAVKGGFLGALAVAAGGALIGGLVIGGITAIFASTATALALGGIAAGVAGAVSLFSAGTIGAATGGIIGLAKGGTKVSRENAAYRGRMEQRMHKRESEMNEAGMMGMQQGYQAGFVEGRNAVINELRAAQEQMLMAQAQPQLAAGGHAARIEQQRAAMANAPQR